MAVKKINMKDIIDQLLYLDNGFISSFYEEVTKKSPETIITRTEGFNASVKIPILSGGASSVESRSYSVSTRKMLLDTFDKLSEYPAFTKTDIDFGCPPVIRWVQGSFSIHTIQRSRENYSVTLFGKPKEGDNKPPTKEIIGEETFFAIKATDKQMFALIINSDYFTEGLDVLLKLIKTVSIRVDIPVRALLRILPAGSDYNDFIEWISCPLLILSNNQ